jgi:hypothetical protein
MENAMSKAEYVIDCRMSRAAAVAMIKTLSDALVNGWNSEVQLRAWHEDERRLFFEVNRDIAAVAVYGEVQA